AGPLDTAADNAVAQAEAEAAIVLLKNDGGALPLAANARRIAVIGGHADVGVLSGGGSSQVIPLGSTRLPAPPNSPEWLQGVIYHPSAPLAAIRAHANGAQVNFQSGEDVAAAVAQAKAADVAVVFAEQWTTEGQDASLRLSERQEALIAAVAAANPNTVVVLENGGPLTMPWIGKARAVLEAWYPGGRGGEAIARVLFGEVNPSGRLPATFAADPGQLPRARPVGLESAVTESLKPTTETPFAIDYKEGSSVGYRWFAETGAQPLFPFGYGLSYTTFRHSNLVVTGGKIVTAKITLENTGDRTGRDTVQLYLAKSPGRSQQRLLGWAQATLKPGERRTVEIKTDPRLLANWDEAAHGWRIEPGRYQVFAGAHAADRALTAWAKIQAQRLAP
ncbi:MAG: glycoside hydrolase family 3 C-terminal domain-containing protein, partial [Proteobacteria bacterium]|nr:glycoside hydrolase family 3 C-terminal domain-containing protein [Pseudomonadota bacterium]